VPLYDYQCRSCGKVAEVRHGFNETYEEACAECKGEMRRVYSPTGIVFKGSGFYVTDSRKNSESGGSSKSGSTKTEATGSGDGSSASAAATGDGGSKAESAPAKSESSPAPSPASGGPSKSESAA
jgi:putative FmdB family regulatory protein